MLKALITLCLPNRWHLIRLVTACCWPLVCWQQFWEVKAWLRWQERWIANRPVRVLRRRMWFMVYCVSLAAVRLFWAV